ncbi:MAG: multiheme c-type cytochrome [Geobacteraceae bacterium]|nr:multiheme c-type cytochrome [Geobacteraceae bacterium]
MKKILAWKLAVLVTAITMLAVTVSSAADTGNEKCLSCHSNKDIIQKSGERLYLDPAMFAVTSHAAIGCNTCHDSVTSNHPTDGFKPSKASCKECHASVQSEYSASIHGGKASCNDCHNPHEVKSLVAVSGSDINAKCAKCHNLGKIVKSHDKWLPQADLHIDALPCVTCHTSSKNYVITMSIQKRQSGNSSYGDFKTAKHDELIALNPINGDVSRLIDKNGDRLISLKELRDFNFEVRKRDMRLWGMMMPEVATHSFQILENRWDCSFCHASGPKAMQKSFMAFPDTSGGYTRVEVENGAILDILYGTPDFYMMGSTRSTALNIIGAMIIAGGMMMPIVHGTFRFLTRKNRKEH